MLAGLLLFFLLYPSVQGLFEGPKSFLIGAVSPLWRAQDGALRNNSPISYFVSKKELLDENQELKNRIEELENLEALNVLLSDENERLKTLLGRSEFRGERVLASILIRPGRIPFDVLLIDAGKQDGVTKGSFVVAQGSNVVGEITEVFETTSRARLFSSGGEVTPIVIGSENISAEAVGLGGGNYEITLPREVIIEEGDIISTSGIEAFVLGVVGSIEKKPADAFQKILFKIPVNIQEVKFVEVLLR